MYSIKKRFLILVLFSLSLSSCLREEKYELNENEMIDLSVKNATFLNITLDAFVQVIEATHGESLVTPFSSSQIKSHPACMEYTSDKHEAYIKNVRIKYGQDRQGCEGNDKNLRYGIITAVYTNDFKDNSSIAAMSFDNYSINDVILNGRFDVTNITDPDAGTPDEVRFKLVMKGVQIKLGSYIMSSDANLTYTWNTNNTPDNLNDDYIFVEGNISGLTPKRFKFNSVINKQLRRDFTCWRIQEGSTSIHSEDNHKGSMNSELNFTGKSSSAACAGTASVIVKGLSHNVEFR